MPEVIARYVLGFLFDGEKVVLIRKERPKWQQGLLNGVGGHIEAGESPIDAMRREFLEETGMEVLDWEHFVTMSGHGFEVICYHASGDSSQCRTMTDEEIVICNAASLDRAMDNLPWLIAMAQSMNGNANRRGHYRVEYVRE